MNASKSTSRISLVICSAISIFAVACASSKDDNTGTGGSGGGGGGDTVSFASGAATGPMTGYGWVALGSQDSLTSPTCDASGAGGLSSQPITTANPCPEVGGKAVWSSDNALCITGSVPIVVNADYTDNWGLQIGVNSSTTAGGVIGKTYTNITMNFDGLPTPAGAVMRAEIHKLGDDAGTTYCATAISGTAMPIASFSKTCWDGNPGSFGADGGPAAIDKIGLQVSADINNAYTVTNLCLHSIVFN